MLLLLAACGSAPRRQEKASGGQKNAPKQSKIYVGDILPSPENCGMIHSVRPVYPKEAKRARIQGVVKVEYLITKTGEVTDLYVISGDPVLVPAAIAAVTRWRFAPCRVDGSEPGEVKSQSDISFTLNQ